MKARKVDSTSALSSCKGCTWCMVRSRDTYNKKTRPDNRYLEERRRMLLMTTTGTITNR